MNNRKTHIILLIPALMLLFIHNVNSQTKIINQKSWSQSTGFAQTIGLQTYDMLFPTFGVDSVSAEWFEMCFHISDLADYLNKQSDYINYFGQTGGTWANADNMLFSVQGNSYRMNKIYKDGFRIDSRFAPGVTFYKPNLFYHNLLLDTHQSKLDFQSIINDDADFFSISGDVSGLFGGPDPGAFGKQPEGFTLYPLDRSFTPIAGELEAQYNVEDRKTVRYYRTFRHHAYADGGMRYIAGLNNDGEYQRTKAYYWRAQADGEIPMPGKMKKIERRDMVRMFYMVNALHRTSGQEFGYNPEELYQMDYYTASVYFRSPEWNVNKYRLYGRRRPIWTMGLTYGMARVTDAKSFTRNAFDPDGIGFEPWTPEGMTHELSFSVNIKYSFNKWLDVHYEGYNSAIAYHATDYDNSKVNTLYYPSELESPETYLIRWNHGLMIGGLFENSVGLEAHYAVNKKFKFRVFADATIDGFLIGGKKSIIRPNWQAQIALDWRPIKSIHIGLTVGNYRIPFTTDDMRFFSDSYSSALIYKRNGDLFSSTGGKFHTAAERLRQPQFFVIDLPIKFAPDRHEISFNTTYKKYYNLWTVEYAADPSEYGFYTNGYFFETATEKQYVVKHQPLMSNNIITNSPFFISNIFKYAYYGNVFLFSASWQTTIYNATTNGNGFHANDILTLSEQTANPNLTHTSRQIVPLGTARLMMGINTKHWRLGITFKYNNGQPWTTYDKAYDLEKERVTWYETRIGGGNIYNILGGQWTDHAFNIDFNMTYRGVAYWDNLYEIQLCGYNLYDFASRLAGNAYSNYYTNPLLTSPRGVTLKLKFEL